MAHRFSVRPAGVPSASGLWAAGQEVCIPHPSGSVYVSGLAVGAAELAGVTVRLGSQAGSHVAAGTL